MTNENQISITTSSLLPLRKRSRLLTNYQIVATEETVTSKKARYQTLLRCLQSTTSCCLTVIMRLVHKNGRIMDVESIRIRISELVMSEECYNLFYENLLKSFPDNNLPSIIQKLIATNICLSSLEEYVAIPIDDDENYLDEPIFVLYKFLLRLCDERPILLLVNDDIRGTNFSHVQEHLEHFVSEQIFMVTTVTSFSYNQQGNIGRAGFGRGNRITSSTVTSKRARYQTLLRCLQSTSSCCLQLLMALIHNKKQTFLEDVAEIKSKITYLVDNKEAFDFFESNLVDTFPKNNLAMIIQVLVTTNIALASLETYVRTPDINDGGYIKNPVFILYKFLLRTVYERPILILGNDDARGTFCAHIQECMENFVAEQTYMKRMEFILRSDDQIKKEFENVTHQESEEIHVKKEIQ
jgi:hypothetical protein